jgi:hypothetical protein
MQYFCESEQRKRDVLNHALLNGIDYLEVVDRDMPGDELPQGRLLVYFLKALPTAPEDRLRRVNVLIKGGQRIRNVSVKAISSDDHVLTVDLDRYGDFATYTLQIVKGAGSVSPPDWLDPILSTIDFSFKVACPSDFDCEPVTKCPPETLPEPQIDYLAKDYSSFRQLMLDRLSTIMPKWTERNPSDIGVAAIEALAYGADHLSYYQDAVATEAYLGTARRRISVRRHARLLDYAMHDGCNASVWLVMHVGDGADGYVLQARTPFLTGNPDRVVVEAKEAGAPATSPTPVRRISITELSSDVEVFETMHDITLRKNRNCIEFYTWGDEDCCLPAGATQVSLDNSDDRLADLKVGDLLLFEEIADPEGVTEDVDTTHRHVVRLTEVEFVNDPLYENRSVVDIRWAQEDALPFPLCLKTVEIEKIDEDLCPEEGQSGPVVRSMSIVRGNVVLADHGRTICDEPLIPHTVPEIGRYRPRLASEGITLRIPQTPEELEAKPASQLLEQDPRAALPDVELSSSYDTWAPKRDLLNSDRFATEFVAETEDDARTYVRFGDDILGRRPATGSRFTATYRVGNGSAGNVGAKTITRVVLPEGESDIQKAITVHNPLPALGGVDPESVEEVKLYAPQAFRTQKRAVTVEDYAAMAQSHPDVQKAVATQRWTGSWHTIFITIDRKDGRAVDAAFKEELFEYLEPLRVMGHDLEVEAPRMVALDIALNVCVDPAYLRSEVKAALLEVFSSIERADGRLGFFHPDNWTFGQPVYLSQVVAAAMQVSGVKWVDPLRFERWGQLRKESATGNMEPVLTIGRLEVARLDNDPNAPENGRIEFVMLGGL